MNQHDQMREALRLIQMNSSDAELVHEWATKALAAEPAPLVRLTDEVLINIYLASKAEWKATNKRQRQRIAVVFGSAIMDAMERVNGRKV